MSEVRDKLDRRLAVASDAESFALGFRAALDILRPAIQHAYLDPAELERLLERRLDHVRHRRMARPLTR